MDSLNPPSLILHIPTELTENALVLSHPRDVASFAQTCRTARALVYEARDQHLWRRLFLEQPFDDPRCSLAVGTVHTHTSNPIDWKKELQWRVYTMRVIQKISTHPPELFDALGALVGVVKNAPPMPEQPNESKDLGWLNNLVSEHDVFGNGASAASDWTDEEQQRLAELWSYIGWRDSITNRAAEELHVSRNTARSFVYDMRNYSRESGWGPFMPDKRGHVNWKHIESAITVVICNLLDLGGLWPDTRPPCGLDATRAYSAPGSHKRDPRDWAGVEGTWRRYVCFMDYRDLFTFNVAHFSPHLPRLFPLGMANVLFQFSANAYDPSFFDDIEFQEATRLIELTLHITRISVGTLSSHSSTASPSLSATAASTSSSSADSPTPEQRPIIHFAGTSRGGNGNEAKVRGSVRMTPDGHIRWRFASIYDGHSQWRFVFVFLKISSRLGPARLIFLQQPPVAQRASKSATSAVQPGS
ncbi:hypothetical protein EW145_g3598 [Phellinidium pouzarii]|uniref:F-box domain-containing protein n=1 Tax=Phellinidium pouzarii TaxID=167371 RepID=A0A4S4L8I5_9AGAM|nr:hypothetical protein EW145_g3598 [Phellinidium pouzarii]